MQGRHRRLALGLHEGRRGRAAPLYSGEVETGLVIVTNTYSGRGLVVRRNHIDSTFDGSGIAPFGGYTGTSTAETDFYDNTILNIGDDVSEIDGYARNYRFFRNYTRGSLSGISLAQALDGPTWIVRNRIIDAGICEARRSTATKVILENQRRHRLPVEIGSGPTFLYHNTAYTTDAERSAIRVQ